MGNKPMGTGAGCRVQGAGRRAQGVGRRASWRPAQLY